MNALDRRQFFKVMGGGLFVFFSTESPTEAQYRRSPSRAALPSSNFNAYLQIKEDGRCRKTTLLQHVLLTFARNRQWRKKMRGRIPFFIVLRKTDYRQSSGKRGEVTRLVILNSVEV